MYSIATGLAMMKSSFFLFDTILSLVPDTATLGTKHVFHYYHNNGDNGKQD
jgi:hypothetical protein